MHQYKVGQFLLEIMANFWGFKKKIMTPPMQQSFLHICVCVTPFLCLIFKRFGTHIKESQQMKVDKIVLKKIKSCGATSPLLGDLKIK